MDGAVDLSKALMTDDGLRLFEQMERLLAEREKPLETYSQLSSAVLETVAIGMCSYMTKSTNPREDVHELYACDPMFRHQVTAIAAELMRVFGRYTPRP
jgi:hypothetical protein